MDSDNLVLEIPVWVCGTQKWVTGLTKRTTCDDVIYALLFNDGKHEEESTDKYTIYERWRDVERPLQGRTKILKIWRAWDAEQCNVQLAMRHVDEPSEYGEFLHSRRRRHKRSRHRDREGRPKHSKTKNENTEQYPTNNKLKSIEHLAKVVINQERKLHDIGSRIDHTNKKIDFFETTIHQNRMAENGEDYVQNAYMENSGDDSMDEFLRNIAPENLEMYIQFCERVIQIEGKIQNEQSKIQNLSGQLEEKSMNEAFHADSNLYENEATDEDIEAELANLQAELNRIVSANMMQKYKAVEITRELDSCDKLLHEKQKTIQQLQRELESVESSEAEDNFLYKQTNKKSLGSNSLNEYVNRGPLEPNYYMKQASESHNYVNQSLSFLKTSTPISERSFARTNHSRQNSKTEQTDNQSDYVNIGAIMEWQEQNQSNQGYDNHNYVNTEQQVNSCIKKSIADTEDSLSIDTDNTSNDSQFGSGNNKDISSKNGLNRSFFHLPHNKSLDSDDLISERIKKEIYAYKSPGHCNLTRSLTNMNGDRSFSCTKSLDDNDSNSDTGLSSMHSDESPNYLETLV